MNIKECLNKIGINNITIEKFGIGVEIQLKDNDKAAAWDLYIELITRIATQYLHPEDGDEKAALESIHTLFNEVRHICKHYGPSCYQFTKIAVIILNEVIRPFTAKWHKIVVNGQLDSRKDEFRLELEQLQKKLRKFTVLLANMCGVEDITDYSQDN